MEPDSPIDPRPNDPRARESVLPTVDSAWLRMESPTNLMTITGVMMLGRKLEPEALEKTLREKFLVHDRFHQRVVDSGLGKARLIDVGELDLAEHVRRVTLPQPADRRALQDYVSELMGRPLDPSRPLWEWHYIDNFLDGSAVVARIHHCIGDGMSLIQVLLKMTETGAGGDALDGLAIPSVPGRRKNEGEAFGLGRALRVSVEGARNVTAAVASLGRLLFMRADPASPLRGELGREKRAAWSERIPLERIKFIRRRLGGTVNDVLLSAVAGALRRYIRERSGASDLRDVRAVVPVNLRRPHEMDSLGNRFGLVFLPLPVGQSTPSGRLRLLRERMDRIKRSPDAFVVFGVLRALGVAGSALQAKVIRLLSKNATAVMTNVPGPREALYFCGAPVDDFMFWVPKSGRLGLGVSILSYRDQVRIGVATDRGLIPEPERIVEAFNDALEELYREALGAAGEDRPSASAEHNPVVP